MCIKTSFLLVKNISQQVVLGTPLIIIQLNPFYVDKKGLHTKFTDQDLSFEFIKGIKIKEINQIQDEINLIQNKKHVKFIQKEIQYMKTKENLSSKHKK